MSGKKLSFGKTQHLTQFLLNRSHNFNLIQGDSYIVLEYFSYNHFFLSINTLTDLPNKLSFYISIRRKKIQKLEAKLYNLICCK